MQFVAFRNYNSPKNQLLEVSRWSKTVTDLIKFVEGISVSGGNGREALEVALGHARYEIEHKSKVTHLFIIGDAPPNGTHNKNEVAQKKQMFDNWTRTRTNKTPFT